MKIVERQGSWTRMKFRRLFSVSSGDFLTKDNESPEGVPVYGGNGLRGYAKIPNGSGPLLIIGRVGAKCGNVHQIAGEYWVSEHALRVLPKRELSLEFFRYLLTVTNFNQFAITTAQPLINSDIVLERDAEIPSINEQVAIAHFLDEKTAKIDTLIEKKRKLIELLKEERQAVINQAVTKGLNPNAKMKPSGIEWLGDVPEHWEVKKLKYVLSLQSGDGISPDRIADIGEYPVYGGNGVMGYTPEFNSEAADIIVGRVGAKCGNVHFVRGRKWISDNALHLSTTEEAEYVALLLHSMNLNRLANQNAQPLITGTLVKDQTAAFPPRNEQFLIAKHVAAKSNELETLISKAERAIELLTEYRTALITEAVTGKLNVRGS